MGRIAFMGDRVVVYGLGKVFHKNKSKILERYNVIGFSDKNKSKCPTELNYIAWETLQERANEYDVLLVTAQPIVIIPDLVNNLDIPIEKIRVFSYDAVNYLQDSVEFYGEHLEDAAVMLLLKMLNYDLKKVKYLEIGTNDPVGGNNSFNLYRCGARGLLVDPLPGVRYAVNLSRPEDEFLQAAVTDQYHGEKISFFECQNSGLSSLSLEHRDKWNNIVENDVQEIKVDLLGINDILGSLDFEPDVILVDAEGEDGKIVRGIEYEKYHPAILLIEVYDMSGEEYYDLVEFMNSKGYVRYTTIENTNAIFVLKEKFSLMKG